MAGREILRAGEPVLFIDRKDRLYLRVLKPGTRITLRNGTVTADDLIGQSEGSMVRNTGREAFFLCRPSYAQLTPNLPRTAQVIYPKDVGPILLWGDIAPGHRVVEVGTGPGAMTIALLRAVGESGEARGRRRVALLVEDDEQLAAGGVFPAEPHVGGGEVVSHSRPLAPQGLSGAGLP